MAATYVAALLNLTAAVKGADLRPGEFFRTLDESIAVKIVSDSELELRSEKGGPNWVCKYSSDGNTLRVIVTLFGSPQALYFKVIAEGLEQPDGRKLYDAAHFDAASLAMKGDLARSEERPAASFSPAMNRPVALFTPRPEYPYEARRKKITGRGIAQVNIAASGNVDGVVMVSSTGSSVLDSATISTLHRWRFSTSPRQWIVRIPISFTLTGAQLDMSALQHYGREK